MGYYLWQCLNDWNQTFSLEQLCLCRPHATSSQFPRRVTEPKSLNKSIEQTDCYGNKAWCPSTHQRSAYNLQGFRVYDRKEDVSRLTPQSLGHRVYVCSAGHYCILIPQVAAACSGFFFLAFSVQKEKHAAFILQKEQNSLVYPHTKMPNTQ